MPSVYKIDPKLLKIFRAIDFKDDVIPSPQGKNSLFYIVSLIFTGAYTQRTLQVEAFFSSS